MSAVRRCRDAASRLIASGLWLAGSSALLATALYFLEAPYVAVIDLSVGAGLVAVLFGFAVMTAGDDGMRAAPGVSRWLAAVHEDGEPVARTGQHRGDDRPTSSGELHRLRSAEPGCRIDSRCSREGCGVTISRCKYRQQATPSRALSLSTLA